MLIHLNSEHEEDIQLKLNVRLKITSLIKLQTEMKRASERERLYAVRSQRTFRNPSAADPDHLTILKALLHLRESNTDSGTC